MRPAVKSGNPILKGHYADPDADVFDGRYWVFPTVSAPYEEETFFDAFSSPDLVRWTKHPRILEVSRVPWVRQALWAPCVVRNEGRYFLFFSGNDPRPGDLGGIGVAVADQPQGPFADHIGSPLIGEHHHGAQPIDQDVFRDVDGQWYIVFGGWSHCVIARLKPDFSGLETFEDGETFREITPDGYREGAVLFREAGRYYLMWSENDWATPNYRVAYGTSDSVLGPYQRVATVLEQDGRIATGAGHHCVLKHPRTGQWFMFYHRRPLGVTDRYHREVCIDRMEFDADGSIRKVRMSNEGVDFAPLT